MNIIKFSNFVVRFKDINSILIYFSQDNYLIMRLVCDGITHEEGFHYPNYNVTDQMILREFIVNSVIHTFMNTKVAKNKILEIDSILLGYDNMKLEMTYSEIMDELELYSLKDSILDNVNVYTINNESEVIH